MNNKGFTLIELLAVIILLSLVTVVSTVVVVDNLKKSKEKSRDLLIENIKIGVQEYFEECENINILESELPENACINLIKSGTDTDTFNGLIPEKYAITDVQSLLNYGFIKSNATDSDNNKIVEDPVTNKSMNGCIFKIMKFNDSDSSWYEVINESQGEECLVGVNNDTDGDIDNDDDNDNDVIVNDVIFSYVEKEQVYEVIKNGVYTIEAWGAQGQSYSSNYIGGKGGYISASISLNKGDILSIVTGGQNGYNGGGTGFKNGGGATTVSLNGKIILIGAGGGGASSSSSGGAGGSGNGSGSSNGTNGGGGSSFSDYDYNCKFSDTCNVYDSSPCYEFIDNNPFYGCALYGDYVDACTVVCANYPNAEDSEVTWFDISKPCEGYSQICDTYYGNPGNGGTSSIGTNIPLITQKDGDNIGNGYVKISFSS